MTDLFSELALGEALVEELVLSFKAQNNVTKGDLVKMSTHTAGVIGTVTPVTDTDDVPIGQAVKAITAGDYGPIRVKGVAKVKGSGAITLGAHIKTAAPGGAYVMTTATKAAGTCGKAVQTFADGDEGLIILDCV